MILCTGNDKEFYKYKDAVENKTVRFTIKQIFIDWWNKFLECFPNIKIRDVVHSNVNRMLKCKTFNLGYALYKCKECGQELIVPHTCKSRICSSCGNKYNMQRTLSIKSKIIKCKHRHVVFTIPEDLRRYFRQDRRRLNYLFDAASITIKFWIKDKYKKFNIIPAFICVLHTFGRNLGFNPHIHMILMDGGISANTKQFVNINFFSYPSLRKRFMKVLLDMIEKDVGKSEFRKIKNELYLRYKDGFYVFAPPSKFKSYKELINYVCRYVARPAMAESRIINYDGVYVTFWYQRHQDDVVVIEKIHAFEFISRLILHIPNRNFKQIRFFGAYHNSTKNPIKVFTYISKEISNYHKKMINWQTLIRISFNKNPLNCPNCSSKMVYYKSVFT